MDELFFNLEVQVFAMCDIGNVRTRNEDVVVAADVLVRDSVLSTRFGAERIRRGLLLGVADGVGGAAAGDEASRFVAEKLADAASRLEGRLQDPGVEKALVEAAESVHRLLLEWGRREEDHRGMATTFSGVLFYGGRVWHVNAGDSRVYSVDRSGLHQLSRDHSLRELTGDPSIPGNIIANCFGSENEFFADVIQVTGDFERGDGFLICSDGLSDLVSDEELENVLSESESLEVAGTAMVERAKSYGGRDNISVLLAGLQ